MAGRRLNRASPEAVAARLREGGLEAVSVGGSQGSVEGIGRAGAGGPLIVAAAAEFVDAVRFPLSEGTRVLAVRFPAAWRAPEVASGILAVAGALERVDFRPHVVVLDPVRRRPSRRRRVEMNPQGG